MSVAGLRADLRRNPRPLVLAALAQGLQALLLLGVGGVTAVLGITDASNDLLNGVLVGTLAIAGGLGLVAVARGLLGAQGWARAPALVWQLICVPVGFTILDDIPALGWALLVSSAVVLVGLFGPASGPAFVD